MQAFFIRKLDSLDNKVKKLWYATHLYDVCVYLHSLIMLDQKNCLNPREAKVYALLSATSVQSVRNNTNWVYVVQVFFAFREYQKHNL